MLSKVDNDLLTQTDRGTPMGEYLRRYWHPVMLAEEVPEPDCPPKRVRILGEDLVGYRDTNGDIGLIDNYCPHRRASMFFGRNEECGLRCVYHGWKFDKDGNCVDMPSEPAESNFKDKVRITAYPAREYGGLIWAYLGPLELMPNLPELEWARVPADQRILSKRLQLSSYSQAVEGGIDSSHVSFLHTILDQDQEDDLAASGVTLQEYMMADTSPRSS
jgi:phthalate 4,5-dioxygenase oxygenase subunit